MSGLDDLKQQRKQLKSKLTRFKGIIDRFKPEVDNIIELQERLKRIEPLYDVYDEVQGQIKLFDEEQIEQQDADRDAFENTFFQCVSKAKECIGMHTRDNNDYALQSKSGLNATQSFNNDVSEVKVRLPTIALPVFDGSYEKWLKFHDTFSSLIDKNTSLSKIQKFYYLESALSGNAARVIQSLGVSEVNYDVAWSNLKDRFEDPKSLTHNHTKALFELPIMIKDSHTSLQQLLDDFNNHISALKALGEATDSWQPLMVYLLSTKLDASTKREWDKKVLHMTDKPSFKNMLIFLNAHCKFLERSANDKHVSQRPPTAHYPHRFEYRKPNVVTSHIVTNKPVCPLCTNSHFIYSCDEFLKLPIKSRISEVQKHRLCFNCLNPDHQNKNCKSGTCKKCNKKHNTLLHLDRVTDDRTIESAETSGSTRTATLIAQASRSEVSAALLSTAIVHVQDSKGHYQDCNVLLDSGSQSHFITEDCCNRLRLPLLNIQQSVSRLGQLATQITHKVRARLQSKCNAFNSTIECLVIPRITENMPNIPVDKKNICIPHNITMADPHFDKPKQVDILIGSGLFWKLLCVGQIRLHPRQPILQKTKLGWILAGLMTGTVNKHKSNKMNQATACNLVTNEKLHDQLGKFRQLENCSLSPKATRINESDCCETLFRSTTTRNSDGHIVVTIPFKDNLHKLSKSRGTAEQRDCQRILWRTTTSQPIKIYQLNTVTSAPYLAIRSLIEVAKNHELTHPTGDTACKAIENDFYVDDFLSGSPSIQEARQLKTDVTQLLASAVFELRKWASNDCTILENKPGAPAKTINCDKDPKTLGLLWNPENDTISYYVQLKKLTHITKRTNLPAISQVFDPLGLVGPATITAKCILQQLWQLQTDWDESLPQHLHTAWNYFQQQLDSLNLISVPRQAFCEDAQHTELHGFCDASERAYGACIYIMSTTSHGQNVVRLLCAKSRVAPLKTMTLPRLELCGAVVLANLAHKVTVSLKLPVENQHYWCDSTIVLHWIASEPTKWKTFVANRTSEIQTLTNVNWQHVPSNQNPADIISRGMEPRELISSELWWNGPQWLAEGRHSWPAQKWKTKSNLEIPEARSQIRVTISVTKPDMDIFNKFSSFNKIKRVAAYCLRFKANALKPPEERIIGFLTVNELRIATNRLLKLHQKQDFASEIRELEAHQHVSKQSRLANLSPFLDDEGLIRVGGRLQYSCLPFEQKHPVLLSPTHRLTVLLIEHEHLNLLHAGCQSVLSSLRNKYWPISGMNTVKKTLRQCMDCFHVKPITANYLMGNLPAKRITPARPFKTCGIDYAGPFYVKDRTRSRIITKTYMCVFVCFVTKAIHLELSVDMTTNSFLNCLRRFIARRGKSSDIYTDNGTNFIGARNELLELSTLITNKEHQDKVVNFLSHDQISWHLIPPHSPHFGGLWESAVKSAKYHLKRILGTAQLTYEELYTVLTQVESCLNSRPLSPLSNDPNDLNPLTPGHTHEHSSRT